jgi:hypothetical protein
MEIRMDGMSLWKNLALLGLVLALPAAALADNQTAWALDLDKAVASTMAELDEVVVSGKLDRLSAVKKAIVAAEDRFYVRFNKLNRVPSFVVNCENRAPTGRRQKVRICEPNYVVEALREDAITLVRTTEGSVRFADRQTVVNSKLSFYQRSMRDIAMSDPEAQRALIERAYLLERYEKLRKAKLQNRKVFWD